jgi:1-acyl-sn-glycerol-3-phosphate acyltransferase
MIRRLRYHFLRWLARTAWWFFGGVEVRGLQNVPKGGACLVMCNHESLLDPIMVHAVCPRILHAMADSSQFGSRAFHRLLPKLYAFPVRGFETDPQAVRQALRRLRAGNAVVIYAEGERSWDGRLQTPRLGAIRLALKAGVPIVPCRVDGTYDAWPRWDRRIRRNRVRVEFREPFRLPKLDARAAREAHLAAATDRVMESLK